MATFMRFDEFVGNLGQKLIDLDTDTFKAILSNTSFDDAVVDELLDITQIANGNGYTTGGVTLANPTWAETGAGTGIWQWTVDDFSWTASGGSLVFQWVVFYDDTSTNDKLIGYIDYGVALTITDGNAFTVDVGANGVFKLGLGTIT